MDITTVNTIVGCIATFIGACVLFVLGAILQYVRSMDRNMKSLYERTVAHEVTLTAHGKWLETIDDKIYKLNNNRHGITS